MRSMRGLAAAGLVLVLSAACSVDQPAFPAWRNESGNVNSIEMAWPDGSGMGAFVDSTVAADPKASPGQLKYRVRVVYDTGFTTTLVQDGSMPVAVGERVRIKDQRVVPVDTNETDPKRNLAHF